MLSVQNSLLGETYYFEELLIFAQGKSEILRTEVILAGTPIQYLKEE